MSRVLKYWKQLLLVAVASIVVTVGLTIAWASSVTVTIEQNVTSIWQVGYFEEWSAVAKGEIDGVEVTSSKIYWESSDPQIVRVETESIDEFGTYGMGAKITATGAGRAIVKAYYIDDAGNVIATTNRTVQVEFGITGKPELPLEWTVGSNGTFWTNYFSDYGEALEWTSSDLGVVEINTDATTGNQGTVVAVGAGSATITVKTPDGQKDSFDIIVAAQANDAGQIKISPNEEFDLFMYTHAASRTNLLWYSENESIATVDLMGMVKGGNAGITRIYYYPNYNYVDCPEYADMTPEQLAKKFGKSIEVRVNFGIANGDITMTVGDLAELIVNTDSLGVNWTSDNTSVVTVDRNGKVTAIAAGTARIKATLDSSTLFPGESVQSGTITVTVVDAFAVTKTEHLMNVGDTFDLSAIVTYKDSPVSWIIKDESVVSINYHEKDPYKITVTALKKGVTTITAVQNINGVNKFASCEVYVNKPVQDITIYPTRLEIDKGAEYPMVITFQPELPDNMEVLWVSSDESIATVDSLGVIKGVGGGDCTISVITKDGIKVASCALHVRVPVTGIKMSKERVDVSMAVGSYQLSYSITPVGPGVNQAVVWESSNPSVATVDQNGFVTFVSPGKATIIAQTVDTGVEGSLIATCEFYISEPVVSVKIDYSNLSLKIGDTIRLTAEVLPETATDKTVTWISSNPSVVTIDSTGLLTAVGSGTAAILCQSNDSGVTSMCNVSVYQGVESIEISVTEMSIRKGAFFWLYATAKPDSSVNKTIIWSSTDTSIATVDKTGRVDAVSPGECVIIATSEDSGVVAKCILKVTEPVDGISLNVTELEIMKGDQFLLIPTITPIDADNKAVTYVSSDESVATVDEKGIITALKGGNCIIVVTTEERGLVASCKVVVNEFVTKVEIVNESPYINKDGARYLTVNLYPESASNKGVIWSSSDESIITVDEKGKIVGVNYGTAIITATAADGSGVFDTVRIRCIKPVSEILVEPSTVTILEGKNVTIKATVLPEDASIKGLVWTSSNDEIASADFNGTIYGNKAGVCYVYATSEDGNNIVGIVKVTVKKAVPATKVTINSKSVVLLPGQTQTVTARMSPSNSTDTYRWVSGDPTVCTVDENGLITAVGQGNTEVYCIADSGIESSCEVIVLALNASQITIEQYDSYILDVFGATENIKWYTNNTRIATVDRTGKVTARGEGVAIITAKVNGKVLYCKVTVTKINKDTNSDSQSGSNDSSKK